MTWDPFSLSILHPERRKADWGLMATWFDRRASDAEREGDLKGLQAHERRAAICRRRVEMIDGIGETPAEYLARRKREEGVAV